MFRDMRRHKQQLDRQACNRILATERRGALSVNGEDGYPYVIPMNFYYDEEGSSIYLHSAMAGHKADAIAHDNKVCFTTWTRGIRQEGDWSFFVDSVVCFGRARIVTEEAGRLEFTKRLGMKYYPTAEEVDAEIERDMPRMLLIRIDIEHMTGKHIHER